MKGKKQTRYFYRFFYPALITLLAVVFLQSILVAGGFSNTKAGSTASQTKFAASWKNVVIGGGGYVTDIYLHPQDLNLVFIRTDNGGIYRKDKSWIPLTDHFPLSESNYYGAEALALDPNNPNLVYLTAGKYLTEQGTIFKSLDRGVTWVKSDLKVPMGGDQNKRWAGHRLAVSPFDSNLLLFGSRQNGLWRSINGGINWNQVSTLSGTPEPEIGILAIAFHPKLPGQVYLSVYGDGIYQSTDAGISWSKMPGSPQKAMKLAIANNDILYVTNATRPGVNRYVNSVWQDITPTEEANEVFNGLSVNPNNPTEVLVSLGETSSTKIYHSQNGGDTWVEKQAMINNTVPWWSNKFFSDHTSAIEFDPLVPNQAWLTDWFGVWRTENINANPAVWTNDAKGHEQVVTFTLVSPPKGALLLSGVADVDGFYHQRLDTYPSKRLGYKKFGNLLQDYFQDTYSIAYCAIHPLNLVRVGGNRWNSTYNGATSTDGGITWERFPTFPANIIPQRVAVSATNPKQFVMTLSEGQALQTSDGGASWRYVLGLPKGLRGPWNWSQPLVADGVNGSKFYYYAKGTVYRSDNGGLYFYPVNTSLPSVDWHTIQTTPGLEGEVWVSLDDQGLYRSTDGGKTFSKTALVQKANLFSFGKPITGSLVPALYVYGTIANQGEGFFMSLNRGRTWRNISESRTPVGNKPNALEASKQKFGLIFVGTNGRGIYYKRVF